nr:reverse transcriptase domain-containing protein [Tanacetum cinerariifolium]
MVKEGIVLGHKISKNRIEVDKAKIDVIAKLPHPTIIKGVRSVLGHAEYSVHFLRRLHPSFPNIEEKTYGSSNLDCPKLDMPFKLMCDASDFAIGAVLGQRHEKHFKPIHYASKTMNDVETNYTTTEKEMLDVVYAFKKFWSYLIMNKSIVHTDHSALKYLFAKKDAKARLLCALWFADFASYHAGNFIVKGENRASRSDKLDDALWAFRIEYKTPIGCTPYKLVYGKACHLSIKLEHKAYWALKQANFDLAVAGDHRKVQLNELNELRDHAYENSLIYKEKTNRIHDSKIKNRVFNVGDRVLLFNSRLNIFSSKLKTRWSGPFTITKVFPYGTVELSQANVPNFKVNGHRVKHYFGGDVPQLDCPDCEVSRALSFCLSFTRASHPQLYFGNPDCPDCEVSRALSFCLSFTRASHPQLHFGNPKTQVNLQLQVQRVRTDNGTEFKNKTLAKFFDEVGITQQLSATRTPQQNGVVERRNRTLVEAARTMLTFANLPSFLWAKAIATACFTQNRLIIHKRFDKTPYELINKRKPNIKFFRVFGCKCYLLNNYEDVRKLKTKGDIGVFVRYSKESDTF